MTKDRATAGRAAARPDAPGIGPHFHGSAIVNSGSRDQESNVVVNALDVGALDDQVIRMEQILPIPGHKSLMRRARREESASQYSGSVGLPAQSGSRGQLVYAAGRLPA